MKWNAKDKSPEDVRKLLTDAWLNIYVNEDTLFNPLMNMPKEYEENPHLYYLYLMSRPEYFSFFCKEILNVNLFPFQAVIQNELWHRKFPMLIASRGASKCKIGETKIITNYGIKTLEEIISVREKNKNQYYNNLEVLGENGWQKVEYGFYNDKAKTAQIKTKCGFEIEATLNDKIRVVRNNQIDWVYFEDIKINDIVVIDRTKDFWSYSNNLDIDLAYSFGALVGDGGYTKRGQISFTTIDSENLNNINIGFEKTFQKKFTKNNKSNCDYYIFSTEIYDKLFNDYGFNSGVCEEKDIPNCILSASKECCKAFIQGLMDTDGCITNRGAVEYSSKSKKLIYSLQFLLLRFGIIGRIKKQWNKKYQRFYYKLLITGSSRTIFYKEIGFKLFRKQNKLLSFQDIKNNDNIDLIPKELILNKILKLYELFKQNKLSYKGFNPSRLKKYNLSYTKLIEFLKIIEKSNLVKNSKEYQELLLIIKNYYFFDKIININYNFKETYDLYIPSNHSFICNGFIAHNTWSLALYALLRAVFIPGRKIVIAGAGFRQSKLVFDYIINFWNNSPLLRDFLGNHPANGYKMATDTCKFTLCDSTIIALPIGTGDKIRGIRCVSADTLIQTDDGLIEIVDYIGSEAYNLLNINNEMETPDHLYKSPKTDVYEIKTKNGYSFKCSKIHQVMTSEGWKLAKDLTSNDYLLLNHNDFFPERYIMKNNKILDEKLSWLIGALISEGTLTNRNYIGFTNTDKNFINKVKNNYDFVWNEQYRPAYKDKRGFDCKESWYLTYSNTEFRNLLRDFGVDYDISYNKTIPKDILRSNRSVVISFLSGLFEGDGSCFKYKEKSGKTRIGIAYYTSSLKLAKQLQVLLLKFNIVCGLQERSKSKLSNRKNYMLAIRGINAFKICQLLNVIKWKNKFKNTDFLIKKPSISIVTKTTTRYYLSTYEGNKNKHLGSFSSREEAVNYFNEYQIKCNSLLKVKSVTQCGQDYLYDFYLPKTHSFIGNGFIQHNSHDLLADEFSSHSEEIFETVLSGFGNVASNPTLAAQKEMAKRLASKLNIEFIEDVASQEVIGNQIVFSGTAYYHFNHFFRYWKRWKEIILAEDNKQKLSELFPDGIPKGFNPTHYSVTRLPIEVLPPGFMDEGQIARAKATMNSSIYSMEMGAVFSEDSNGFFKASLINSCVADYKNSISKEGYENITFKARLIGDYTKKYIIAVDPASENDNFAVVVLELHENHRRIVHCWTTNSKDFKEKRKNGEISETDFYGFCARKIRQLMHSFPCSNIAIDSQGGGKAVYEALHDKDKLEPGDQMIWEIIEPGVDKDCDGEEGLHIVHLINFAKADFTSGANHGMKKDFEDKVLLFPEYDPSFLALFAETGDAFGSTEALIMEDCIYEIEDLKKELTQIVITLTASGRERWDTPDTKMSGVEKGKLRKDRYSALLMANWVARNLTEQKPMEFNYGGFSRTGKVTDEAKFTGPSWLTKQLNNLY